MEQVYRVYLMTDKNEDYAGVDDYPLHMGGQKVSPCQESSLNHIKTLREAKFFMKLNFSSILIIK